MNASQQEDPEEIVKSLTPIEQLSAKRMSLVEVRGKSTRGLRKVYILLDELSRKAANTILENRKFSSMFVFGRPSSARSLDGTAALAEVIGWCQNLEKPERIRSRGLRKYLATACQVLKLPENELRMLADHMGHDLNIHTNIYRLQTSLIERAKVARILVATHSGTIHKFQEPRDLNSISANNIHLDNDTDGDDEEEKTTESSLKISTPTPITEPSKMKSRWPHEEKRVFQQLFDGKNMIDAKLLQEMVKKFPSRSKEMIRTRCNNIIKGKQKY
ncbi:hypothetical protein EB796_016279 [Bugula neritina]|uniref:Uncharacterized protein n=1 Tax=Bugula neritina TaxID=10212 RepID=A0A7J7JJ39_BUGNE|nr:hypothetical protein EB796_016279 [Bugula neritina]